MNRAFALIDRHPSIGVMLVVAIFGIVGTMDRTDEEVAAAYLAGYEQGAKAFGRPIQSSDSSKGAMPVADVLCRTPRPAPARPCKST